MHVADSSKRNSFWSDVAYELGLRNWGSASNRLILTLIKINSINNQYKLYETIQLTFLLYANTMLPNVVLQSCAF